MLRHVVVIELNLSWSQLTYKSVAWRQELLKCLHLFSASGPCAKFAGTGAHQEEDVASWCRERGAFCIQGPGEATEWILAGWCVFQARKRQCGSAWLREIEMGCDSRGPMCFSLRRSSTWVWDSARGESKIFPLFFEMDGLRDDGFWSPSCCWGGSGIDRPEIRHSGAGHDHVPSPRDDPICRVKLYWKVWTWNRLRHVPSDWSASVLTSAWTLNRLRHVPSDWSASVLTSEAASRRPRDL